MTTSSSRCSAWMRRALARASRTERVAVSSMNSGRLGEAAGRVDDAAPLGRLKEARSDLLRVDAGLGADEPLHQLLLGHLQAEDQRRPAQLHGGVRGEVEREGRLPRGRAPRDDHEVGALEPRGAPVELREPRGQAGDVLLAVVERLDVLDRLGQDLADGERAPLEAALRDAEEHLLGPVQERLDVVRLLVALLHDLAGDADHAREGAPSRARSRCRPRTGWRPCPPPGGSPGGCARPPPRTRPRAGGSPSP